MGILKLKRSILTLIFTGPLEWVLDSKDDMQGENIAESLSLIVAR